MAIAGLARGGKGKGGGEKRGEKKIFFWKRTSKVSKCAVVSPHSLKLSLIHSGFVLFLRAGSEGWGGGERKKKVLPKVEGSGISLNFFFPSRAQYGGGEGEKKREFRRR